MKVRGWSLVESLLVVGGLVSVGALAVTSYNNSSLANDVKLEQQNLRELSSALSGAYGKVGSYSTVTTAAAAQLAPARMLTAPGQLGHSWGGPVAVSSVGFSTAGDGVQIRYSGVPSAACTRLATSAGSMTAQLLVNGHSVQPVSFRTDPVRIAQQCGFASNTVDFQFRDSAGSQIAAAPLAPPAADPNAPPAPPCVGCPPTPIAPPVLALSPSGLVAVAPITAPTSVVSPTTTPQNNTVCELTESRALACAAGQTGSRTESRTRASCAAAWSGWTVVYDGCRNVITRPLVIPPTPSGCPQCVANTTFVQNENYDPSYPATWTCAATPPAWATGCPSPCAAPAPETTWVNRSDANCPAGYTGTRRWQAEQRRTASCPAPYGPFNWSGWSDTGATRNLDLSSCLANCVAPANTSSPLLRNAGNEDRNVGCPAGYGGAHWQTRTLTENGTRYTNYSCPAATGPYNTSVSDVWHGTYNYGAWTTTSNTCQPLGCQPSQLVKVRYVAGAAFQPVANPAMVQPAIPCTAANQGQAALQTIGATVSVWGSDAAPATSAGTCAGSTWLYCDGGAWRGVSYSESGSCGYNPGAGSGWSYPAAYADPTWSDKTMSAIMYASYEEDKIWTSGNNVVEAYSCIPMPANYPN